jgi:hypothetical protein
VSIHQPKETRLKCDQGTGSIFKKFSIVCGHEIFLKISTLYALDSISFLLCHCVAANGEAGLQPAHRRHQLHSTTKNAPIEIIARSVSG